MKNIDILSQYYKSDLKRLAKGKTVEIVGMDTEKILSDLSRVLNNYESVRKNIEFRKPPVQTILEVMYEAPDNMVLYGELRPMVRKKIQKYQKNAQEINLDTSNKRFRLYANILNAAWEFKDDLVPAEANILRVLREELKITRHEHQMIMAHPEIRRLTHSDLLFNQELEYLNSEGIVLMYKKNDEQFYVLSEEAVVSLEELWQIELEPEAFKRMLEGFSTTHLYTMLKEFGLPVGGAQREKISRFIKSEIKPSALMDTMSVADLNTYMKKMDIQRSGNKEEKISRIREHFKMNLDIIEESDDDGCEKGPIEYQERSLSEEKMMDLLSTLTVAELDHSLRRQKQSTSGTKASLVDRLTHGQFNSRSILTVLTNDELQAIMKRNDIPPKWKKSEMVDSIIKHFNDIPIPTSKLLPQHMVEYYNELSRQNRNVYPEDIKAHITTTAIALDFEAVTSYIFRNIFNLDVKRQKFGHQEPDGRIKDDNGNLYLYECKTVLNPPYNLPNIHRLQIRNYIERLSVRDKERIKGYLIISNSYDLNIENKLSDIRPPIDIPISVIEASVLENFALKWKDTFSTDALPIHLIIKNGLIRMKDFESVIH